MSVWPSTGKRQPHALWVHASHQTALRVPQAADVILLKGTQQDERVPKPLNLAQAIDVLFPSPKQSWG